MALIDGEATYRINASNWEDEFPEVMKAGGFDAVIGNPPYIDSEWMTQYLADCRNYCSSGSRYRAASGNWDMFCVFIEKALKLCKPSGLTSMIVPNKLGSADYAAGARDVLTNQNRLVSIRDYSDIHVFPVAVYPIVYVAQRVPPQQGSSVRYERMALSDTNAIECSKLQDLDYTQYFADYARPWPIFSDIHIASPVERLRVQFPKLGAVANVLGAATVAEAYELKPLIQECPDEDTSELMVINSGTVDRYNSLWGQKQFRYLGNSYLRPIVPSNLKNSLPKKRKQQAEQAKIIIAGMTKSLECAIDPQGSILAGKSTSVVFSSIDLRYLLGLLNSRLIDFYYKSIFGGNKMQGGYLRIGPPQLRQLPVRTIDLSDPTDKAQHDQLVGLVERMLDLHKQLVKVKVPQTQALLRRQIRAIDQQIDKLVYGLYSLTGEEIKVVEEEE
jgi:hypothetical protein